MRPFVCGWVSEWVNEWVSEWVRVGASVDVTVTLYLVDTIENSVFGQSLLKFTCKIVDNERMNPIDLGSQDQRSRSNFALCLWNFSIKPCGHFAGCSNIPITFEFHMQVVDDERRNPFDFGSRGQGQGQFWYFVYKIVWYKAQYGLQFLQNNFQSSHVSCRLWGEGSYWCLVAS